MSELPTFKGWTPDEFFAREASKPFRFERDDCLHTAERWVRRRLGFSILKTIGDDYRTEEEAADRMKQSALPRIVGRGMRKAGFKQTRTPEVGDVAVILAPGCLACAVRGETGWLWRDKFGVHHSPADSRVIAAWSVITR